MLDGWMLDPLTRHVAAPPNSLRIPRLGLRQRRVLLLRLPLPALLIVALGCAPAPQIERIDGRTMGTTYQVTVPAGALDLPPAHIAIDSLLDAINLSMSTYIDSSLTSRINTSADTSAHFPLDSHFIAVFERTKAVYEATAGAFNPAVAPLIDAWGFGNQAPRRLSQEQVDSLLALVDFSAFELLPGGVLRKKIPGAQLNFSAIAKGYGVDAIGEWLEAHGVRDYFVEIGGEVRIRGRHPEGRPWYVGIDRPVPEPVERRVLQAVVPLTDAAMATSGNYRNYYERDGQKYVHTINPRTGYPEVSSLLSASVIAPDCMTADAYATAFMVMGMPDALRHAERDPALEAFFIEADSSGGFREWQTSGFPEKRAPDTP